MRSMLTAALLAAAAASPLLAQQRSADAASEPAPTAPACANCGVVTSIRSVPLRGEPQWLGTISALPGSGRPSIAIGAGRSAPARDAAVATRRRTVYEVVVLMDDQSTKTLHYEHRPALSVGDKVQVAGQQVYLR